jgi:hypothetical protein
LADAAPAEAASAQKDKGEAQRLAVERLALIERMEQQVEASERDKAKLVEEIEKLHKSEMDAMSKAALLENSVRCFFEKHSIDVDIYTRMSTHSYKHTHAYVTFMSIFERLSRFDFKIYEVGHQECFVVDGDVASMKK